MCSIIFEANVLVIYACLQIYFFIVCPEVVSLGALITCYAMNWAWLYSHLLYTLTSPLTCAVYPWSVHCECITSFFGRLTYIETLWNLWNEAWLDLVPHSGSQWKCLVLDTPSFYDHIWSFKHKMALCALQCVIGYATWLYLVMYNEAELAMDFKLFLFSEFSHHCKTQSEFSDLLRKKQYLLNFLQGVLYVSRKAQ